MVSGVARGRVKGLHVATDPALRPGPLPEPWAHLEWRQLAPTRNRSKPRIFWAADGERRVVCKDSSAVSWLHPLGAYRRLVQRREAHVLGRLAGVRGVPGLLARWPAGIVMEYVPGRMLTTWPREGIPAEVFDRLDRIVADIHARGIAIGDVHRRNILVSDDLQVHLVDFEVGLDGRRGIGRLLARPLMRLDRYACVRQRLRFGVPLNAEQQALYDHPPLGYGALRAVKRWVRGAAGSSGRHGPRTEQRAEDER